MIAEGQTLIRTGADFLFFSAALRRDSSVFDRMANNDDRHRLTQANALLKFTDRLRLNDEQIKALKELVERPDRKLPGISSERAARIAGLEELYETLYRGLSFSASHPTLKGLDFVLVEGDDGGLAFGPSTDGLAWSLGLLLTCLTLAIETFNDLLKHSAP